MSAGSPLHRVEEGGQRLKKRRPGTGYAATDDHRGRVEDIDERGECGGQSTDGVEPYLRSLDIPCQMGLDKLVRVRKAATGAGR